jgi:hypothetical protein
MQNRDVNLTDQFYLNIGGGDAEYDTYIANFDQDFSFSGFGSNDPKRRRAFTPGSYTITEGRRYAVGTFLWTRQEYYYRWYPASDYVDNKGIIDASGNNSARISLGTVAQSDLSTVVYNNALTKLYDRLRSSELNLALTIGERKESARMLQKAFAATASVVQKARSIRRQILTNPSLLASNLWLQAKYGWLPLYNDVYEATKFHYHLFSEMRFEGKSKRKVEWDDAVYSNWIGSVPLKRTHEQRCQFIIYAGVADSDAYNLSRITSLNPLSIAWELVPFSFVADWFVDIGGYLANMEASLGTGLSFGRGMVTEVAHTTTFQPGLTRDGQWDQVYWSSYFVVNKTSTRLDPQKNWRREVTKTRTLLTSFPRARFPVFQVSLGSQRIISAGALIRQVLLGSVQGKKW